MTRLCCRRIGLDRKRQCRRPVEGASRWCNQCRSRLNRRNKGAPRDLKAELVETERQLAHWQRRLRLIAREIAGK